MKRVPKRSIYPPEMSLHSAFVLSIATAIIETAATVTTGIAESINGDMRLFTPTSDIHQIIIVTSTEAILRS